MQQPRAIRFRRHHGPHALARERGERRVVDDHRQVKHAAERLIASRISASSRVTSEPASARTTLAFTPRSRRLCDEGFRFRGGCAAAAAEHEVPGTAFHQPLGEHFSEAAKCAGDQVTAVGLTANGGASGSPRRGTNASGKDTTTLPICLPLAMSRNAASMRHAGKERKGSGVSAPFFDQFGKFAEHLPRQRFVAAEDRVHRDDVERRIAPQRPERDARVLVNVAFADLDEAAELRQARESHRDRFGGERIENDVHAAPAGQFHDGFGEVAAPRVDHMLHAERLEQRAFGRAARRGDDFRAEVMRDLDRRHADAARARVDEDTFAGSERAPRS